MDIQNEVYLVTEGEVYYDAWIPHLVVTDQEQAENYARDLVKRLGAQRWPNVHIFKLSMGKPGSDLMEYDAGLIRPEDNAV